MHRLLALPKPLHPMVSVIDFSEVTFTASDIWQHFTNDLYAIALKKGQTGKVKYGQNKYDFDEGLMTFSAPKQVFAISETEDINITGYLLTFHPDFIQQYPLAKVIIEYGFFSYDTTEALFLSDREEKKILDLMLSIKQEYNNTIDNYSQDIIITNIELLLVYINRYYNRQFITRKNINNTLLTRLNQLLTEHFNQNNNNTRIPTVQYLASELHISPTYLNDLLKSVTGQTTQQHIHEKLLNKAKELLSTTELSVAQIAYQLGFEYPQSFHKLFKNKVNVSPLQYRQSFIAH